MRENRFYLAESLAVEQRVELDRSVAVHITKVLRMGDGEIITIFNGDGFDYKALLQVANKKVSATIIEMIENHTQSPVNTHLAQGICRGDRMDYSIQKAVEMGVSEITPVITERVQFRQDKKRLEKKMRHWQGVIIAACEQCGRADIPSLHPVLELATWLTNNRTGVITLAPNSSVTIKQALTDFDVPTIGILVGPEGGLTDAEINLAKGSGIAVTLGPRILRTETAGTAVLALIQHLKGDL